jgi:hypothetical protein
MWHDRLHHFAVGVRLSSISFEYLEILIQSADEVALACGNSKAKVSQSPALADVSRSQSRRGIDLQSNRITSEVLILVPCAGKS